MTKEWIIGICNSAVDGVLLYRYKGSESEVKEKLLDLVIEAKSHDEKNWDFGSLDVNEFYAYACFIDYHIEYTARELAEIHKIEDLI